MPFKELSKSEYLPKFATQEKKHIKVTFKRQKYFWGAASTVGEAVTCRLPFLYVIKAEPFTEG